MRNKIVFVADSHLLYSDSLRLKRFCEFLKVISDKTSSIYFLGDIFEYWIGDEKIFLKKYETLLKSLYNLSRRICLYFIPGNRDYLLGKRFGRIAGVNILGKQEHIDLEGKKLLITHGDFIFNKNPVYTLYRRVAQLYPVSNAFLQLPAFIKSHTAMFIRKLSKKQKKQPELSKEVVILQTRKIFSKDIDILICAHVHLRQMFEFEFNNRLKKVFILGHFEADGSYLEYDGDFIFKNF